MGRVSRYKKVKSFDPYSKQNGGKIQLDNVGIWGLGKDGRKKKTRSKTAEKLRAKRRKTNEAPGFDVAPSGKDDFDMADLFGSLKKEKPEYEDLGLFSGTGENSPATAAGSRACVSSVADDIAEKEGGSSSKREEKPAENPNRVKLNRSDSDEERKVNKLLMIEEQLKGKKETKLDRLEGESKNAYRKRVRAETRQIIRKERMSSLNPEKRRKKKDFLNQKKKRKTRSCDEAQGGSAEDEPSNSGERTLAEREAATRVHFGEQAQRPPMFKQLPRGATRKSAKTSTSRNTPKSEEVAAERLAMESMRRKVQAQYAVIKQKRKQGNFHL